MRWLNVMAILMLIGLVTATTQAQAEQPAEEPAPETFVRTYNISDLMRTAPDYPLDSAIEPPTGFGVRWQEGGGRGGGDGMFRGGDTEQSENDPLSRLIVDTVSPDSWKENGGIGMIRTFNQLLVITQSPDNHKRIENLLAEIRRNSSPAQILAVRATWLLVAPADAPPPGSVVTDEWILSQRVYCEGRTVCFSGQRVHITSGRGRTIVKDVTPIVGDVAAFDPQPATVQSGVSLQIGAQIVPGAEAAIVDLESYASEWDQPGEPIRNAAIATTAPAAIDANTTASIDRINMLAQQMKTTLRVPLGERVVVGGMTFEPAADEAQASQICLVVEVSAVK